MHVIPAWENQTQEGFKFEATKGETLSQIKLMSKMKQGFSESGLSDRTPRQGRKTLSLVRAKYNSQGQETLLA